MLWLVQAVRIGISLILLNNNFYYLKIGRGYAEAIVFRTSLTRG